MDFEDTCVPKSQREASFTIAALHQWEMHLIDDVRCVDSAEEVSVSFVTSSLFKLLLIILLLVDCGNFEASACWRSFSQCEFLEKFFL